MSISDYIGRGIIMGLSSDCAAALQLYILTSRSPANQSRRLHRSGRSLYAEFLEPFFQQNYLNISDLTYKVAGDYRNWHVISNGIQTQLVLDRLHDGYSSFELGEVTRAAPPQIVDSPRISGICSVLNGSPTFRFASVVPDQDQGMPVVREVLTDCIPGRGFCLTTYTGGDENPLPVFRGDPIEVDLTGEPTQILDFYWQLLNPQFRISIALKIIDLRSGNPTFLILNRHDRN